MGTMLSSGTGWAPLVERVDELMEEYLKRNLKPGVSVAVSQRGRLLLSKGYGHALLDGERKIPMTPCHRIKFGSCTKALITGPSAYQLLQEKGIDPKTTKLYGPNGFFKGSFDDDIEIGIRDHAPQSTPWREWYRKITMQHLFDHQAGFPDSHPDAAEVATCFNVDVEQVTVELEHACFLRKRALRFEPGNPPANLDPYTNHGFGLWALIIQRLSGKPYADYVRSHYLRPQGLHNAVRWSREHPDSCDAYGHTFERGRPTKMPFKESTLRMSLAAGGWMMSAQSVVALTASISKRYTVAKIDSMGWFRHDRDKLDHSGGITGGVALVVMFPDGYRSSTEHVDLSEVHVAIGANMSGGDADDGEEPIGLKDLANHIAVSVPKSNPPHDFDLWKDGKRVCSAEYVRRGMPDQEYQAIFDEAVRSGYRLEWIDGYTAGGQVRFNVIFRTNHLDQDWASFHNLTGAAYQQKFDELAAKGLTLEHVDSYAVGNSILYAAIWSASGVATTAYHGASTEDHQRRFNELTASGWSPKAISVASVNGKLFFTAIYVRTSMGTFEARQALTAAEYQQKFDDNASQGRRIRYLNTYAHQGTTRYSAIWTEKPVGIGGPASHGLTDGGFISKWEDALGAGFRTRAITAVEDDGKVRFAAFWTK